MIRRSVVHMCLIYITFLTFLVAMVFNMLAALVYKPLFRSGPGQVVNQTRSDIDPAGWTFSVWGVIYIWQATWIIYTIATIFLKGVDVEEGNLYRNPIVIPPSIHAIFICNLVLNVAWIFIFDREHFIAANIALVAIAVSLYTILAISTRATLKYSDELIKSGFRRHLYLIIGLLQNAIGMYAGWTTVASLLNLNIALIHLPSGVSISTSGTLSLSILLVLLVAYAVLDQFVFTRALRFVFTPYVVWTWALTGVVANNVQSLPATNAVYNVVLLGVIAAGLLMKIVSSVIRQKLDPIYVNQQTSKSTEFIMSNTIVPK